MVFPDSLKKLQTFHDYLERADKDTTLDLYVLPVWKKMGYTALIDNELCACLVKACYRTSEGIYKIDKFFTGKESLKFLSSCFSDPKEDSFLYTVYVSDLKEAYNTVKSKYRPFVYPLNIDVKKRIDGTQEAIKYRMFYKQKKASFTYDLLPSFVWMEVVENITTAELTDATESSLEQLKSYTFSNIESNGLFYNAEKAAEHDWWKSKKYKKITLANNVMLSSYNLDTLTGRPSNALEGINFMAFPKANGCRDIFESRFDGGFLMELDLDGSHIRLATEYFSDTQKIRKNVKAHDYLASLYFQTNDVSEAQYMDGKELTFKYMYSDELPKHEGLRNMFMYIKNKLAIHSTNLKTKGAFQNPVNGLNTSIKVSKTLSNTKVYSYILQNMEAAYLTYLMYEILKKLKEYKLSTCIILSVYDGILLDVNRDELEPVLKILNDVHYERVPFHLSIGNNYGNLKQLDGLYPKTNN